MNAISRRNMLTATSGAVAALALGLRGASAAERPRFEIVTATASTSETVTSLACGTPASHRQLIADLERSMPGKTEAEKRAAIAKMACPVCGCPLAG
jgi:hypothetical protein